VSGDGEVELMRVVDRARWNRTKGWMIGLLLIGAAACIGPAETYTTTADPIPSVAGFVMCFGAALWLLLGMVRDR
jgi:peptidoglycan/LPS O-acetylase OafA/YrhL